MTIEQKPELNRLVDSSYPITWPKRWRAFKLTLPIWIFIWVCMLEMAVLKAWLTNRISENFVSSLTGGLIGGFIGLWGVIELALWFDARSKRILRVKDKHLVVSPSKHQYIRWKSITQFQLEPVAENPVLTKFSVFVRHSKQIPNVRRFAMIIDSHKQVCELTQVLEVKRQTIGAEFKIITLHKPEPARSGAPLTTWAMSLTLAGFYFFLHGLPLLGIALLPREHHSSDHSDFDPDQVAKLGKFLADHFSAVEQIRHFYLFAGLTLTLVGLALMFWRSRLPSGKPKV